MRILEVTHYMPPHSGGIERVAASLVDGLGARGHDVHWVASAVPAMPSFDTHLVRVPALNVLEDRLGVPYPVWSPGGLATLDREVARADVVHVHDCLYMGSASATASAKRHGKPVLVTQHVGYVPFGRALDRVQKLAYRTLGRATLGAADARVACSAHVPAYFRSLGITVPFTVIPNALDAERFAPPTREQRESARDAWGVGRDARVVLFVGRLVPKKGIERVAAVQRALASEGISLVVVGDGPLAHVLAGVPGLVHHASVPPAKMPELYALADAFLLPSRGEGLPLSVQEAMLAGCNVIVSDDPSYTANLADAPGVSLTRDDPSLLAAVRAALASPVAPGVIARWARAQWSSAQFIAAYDQLLTDLVARRAARS